MERRSYRFPEQPTQDSAEPSEKLGEPQIAKKRFATVSSVESPAPATNNGPQKPPKDFLAPEDQKRRRPAARTVSPEVNVRRNPKRRRTQSEILRGRRKSEHKDGSISRFATSATSRNNNEALCRRIVVNKEFAVRLCGSAMAFGFVCAQWHCRSDCSRPCGSPSQFLTFPNTLLLVSTTAKPRPTLSSEPLPKHKPLHTTTIKPLPSTTKHGRPFRSPSSRT